MKRSFYFIPLLLVRAFYWDGREKVFHLRVLFDIKQKQKPSEMCEENTHRDNLQIINWVFYCRSLYSLMDIIKYWDSFVRLFLR